MRTTSFTKMSEADLVSVNGGALGGAVIGFVVGGIIGYVAMPIVYNDSIRSGSSPAMAENAAYTAYTSCCTVGAIVGSYLPF